jgi:hypothetical protein
MAKKKNGFEARILELELAIDRLRKRQSEGWRYRRTWIRPTTVKKHTRDGYFAMLPIKRVKK